MAKKTLYCVQVATETKVEKYIKEKRLGTVPVRAENVRDFLDRSSDKDVTEIIFDYTCVNYIYNRGKSFDPIKEASLRGVAIKIVLPEGLQKEMQKEYKKEIKKLIPDIEEKLFD